MNRDGCYFHCRQKYKYQMSKPLPATERKRIELLEAMLKMEQEKKQ